MLETLGKDDGYPRSKFGKKNEKRSKRSGLANISHNKKQNMSLKTPVLFMMSGVEGGGGEDFYNTTHHIGFEVEAYVIGCGRSPLPY